MTRKLRNHGWVWSSLLLALGLLCPYAEARTWKKFTPISVNVTAPDTSLVYRPTSNVPCTVSASDIDCYTDNGDDWYTMADSVQWGNTENAHHIEWSVKSGEGTLPYGNYGTSVTFKCPNTYGDNKLEVRVDDNNLPGDPEDNITDSCANDPAADPVEITIKVIDVVDVEWEAYTGNEALIPYGGEGEEKEKKRIFPEKTVWDDDDPDRNKVFAKVTLSHTIPEGQDNFLIYFRAYDVDDDSDDDGPIDDDSVGYKWSDNKPNGQLGMYVPEGVCAPEGESIMRVACTISNRYPGNNWKVCATAQYGSYFDGKPDCVNDVAGDYQSNKILVCWRKLHVELDDMGVPNAGHIFGVATGDSTGLTDTELTDSTANWNTVGVGDLSGGELDPNTDDAISESHYVLSNTATTLLCTPDLLTNAQAGDPYAIDTDDVDPGDVGAPDTGLMAGAYETAFIVPAYDTGNNTTNCGWVRNLESDDRWAQGNQYRSTSESSTYWAAYIVNGYEAGVLRDGDPDWEGAVLGVKYGTTYPDEPEYAWVFKESIRDGEGAGSQVQEQRTVVHEIGHQFGLEDHDEPGANPCVMNRENPSSSFCQNCQNAIRNCTNP